MALYNLVAGNLIGFANSAQGALFTPLGGAIQYLNASNTLTISQLGKANLAILDASSVMVFRNDVEINKDLDIQVGNTLEFTQYAGRFNQIFAGNLLLFANSSSNSNFQEVFNEVVFTQVAVASRGINTNFAFTQSVVVTKVIGLTVSNSITYVSSAASTNGILPSVPTTAPDPNGPVTLTYGSLSVVLTNVELGNTDSIEQSRIQMNSRAGDLIIFRDPQWPTSEKIKLQFKNLSQVKAKSFLAFIDATLGQDITLVDYEGFSWTGTILNPETAVTQEGPELGVACGGFNAEIEFQGVKT